MIKESARDSNRYSLLENTPDVAATYLVLDAIAKYPQMRHGAAHLIAEYLLKNIGKSNVLSISQAKSAQMDTNISWKYTKKIHAVYGVGTDRPQFRDPDKTESPQIYPKDPEWLANFVKAFIDEAIDLIRDKVRTYLIGTDGSSISEDGVVTFVAVVNLEADEKTSTAEKLQQTLEENPAIVSHVLHSLEAVLEDVKKEGMQRRESLRDEAEEKYGKGGVKYD
ncbi:hypothetical protein KBD71_01470 [Candidatus Woesebacteria bacterium]|nr:hypothetical protein [Candidatus Woesebacteria bacterium]